jgi:serine/threonine-protein kinase
MKPSNIVVNEKGDVKIIDLGQACPIGTVKERIQGTPDFIAPEQVHLREITPKTDIYNLGATMYWILTQRHIPTALPKGDSLVSSLDDRFIEKPTPIRELNVRIPEKLADLVMRCVEVDATKRPASMFEVGEVLAQVRDELRGGGGGVVGVTPPLGPSLDDTDERET